MKLCVNCNDCLYIGEGDFICTKSDMPKLVLEEFTDPTDNYGWCNYVSSTVLLREERKKSELCTQCGEPLDREGSYCSKCNTKNNETKIKKARVLCQEKKCSSCGKPSDREGWFCTKCANKLRTRAKLRVAERKSNNQCIQCAAKVSDGRTYCRRCLDMLKERRYKKKMENEGNKNIEGTK